MTTSDEAAVLAVVERRSKAFSEHDFETYASLHAHAPYVSWWHASPVNGNFVRRGWDETAPLLRGWMAASERDTRGADDGIIEDRVVRVSGKMAWVTFTRRYPNVPAHRAGPNAAHGLRILEKHEGEWKIVLAGFLDPSVGAPRASIVRLDTRGKILWKSPTGETALWPTKSRRSKWKAPHS